MVFSTESAPRAKYPSPSDRPTQTVEPATNVACTTKATGLEAVQRAPVNLAVWQRRSNDAVLPVAHWLAKEPFELEFELEVQNVTSTLQNHLQTPPEFNASRSHLIADIQELAMLFSKHASTNSIRLMIEALHRVPCPKFHQDNVHLRLVCTYTGIGTEWLENSNVNPHPDCCGGSIVLDETRIKHLQAFEVGLMKGKRWPGNRMGIFHRSPTISADRPRLVVKMDVGN